MLDIKLIRTQPELVKENIKKKFQFDKLALVDEVIALDPSFARRTPARTICARSATRSANPSVP
jgi:seryl-tRNA synthetase